MNRTNSSLTFVIALMFVACSASSGDGAASSSRTNNNAAVKPSSAGPAGTKTASPPAGHAAKNKPKGTLLHAIEYVPGPAWIKGAPLEKQPLGPHLAYVQTLHKKGVLVANGLYGDEARGLYFVAATRAEVDTLVARDPAVRARALKLDRVTPWFVMLDGFGSKQDKATKFFVLSYTPGEKWRTGAPLMKQNLSGHMAYVATLFKSGTLIAGGPIPGADRGRYIVAVNNVDAVRKLVASDPGVRDGVFKASVRPWRPFHRASIAEVIARRSGKPL